MLNMGIYEIRNLRDGKRYIGSAVRIPKRWNEHRRVLKNGKHHSQHLQRAWAKYGHEAFSFNIVEHVKHSNELIRREQWWLDALWAAGWHYNCSPTAGSTLGAKHSEETRAKVSAAHKGKQKPPRTVEHQSNLTAALMGRKMPSPTPEVRAKISAAQLGNKHCLGRKHSAETRARMSAAKMGKVFSSEHRARIAVAATGRQKSAEHRAKLSAAHKGKKLSAEHRAKLLAVHLGRKNSPETLIRMSAASTGRTHSPETRARISAARRFTTEHRAKTYECA